MAKACTEATSSLKFCITCSELDLALELQGFCVGIGMQAGYTLGQWRGLLAVGFWWLGQWQWGSVSRELVEG